MPMKPELISSSTTRQKTSINLSSGSHSKYKTLPWIQWKNYSCRIDVFASVVFQIFYYDFVDEIFPPLPEPKLPNEIHSIGILLTEMRNSKTLTVFQKAVDKYIAYRSKYLKEKQGQRGVIVALFSEFKRMPHFTWTFQAKFVCKDCHYISTKTYSSEPLIQISFSSLQNENGLVSNTIQRSISSYLGQCPNDYKYTVVEKEIINVPNYYCCVLEYAEEIQLEDSKKQPVLFFDLENLEFT